FDDIDFDKLPNQFCLKCTHDSGSYIICKDKSTFDIDAARKKFNRYMKGRFFWYGREWAYKNVKPRIMAQEYIDSLGKPESVEYKLTCFNGKVKFITVCSGIAHSDYELRKNDHFDRDWNKLDWYAYYKPSGKVIKRPEFMDEIIEISDKLAEGFPQVRIDSYVINEKVYFGEMTFYTWSGLIEFTPDEWDEKIGSWWNLPEKM
ncbi:MAG: glycosyl transferase, partial [Paludibacteraceae bacterium]|nr:glycosyl transferase [Paludibacteraceae bacterium]